MLKKLPIGIQTFQDIINTNLVYVDKTPQALELIENGRYYFLSRPRRFGKSLFLSTLKNIFEANKELFKGLHIYDKYDWDNKYPVIDISFANGVLHSKEELNSKIHKILKENQNNLKVECEEIGNVSDCFRELIIKTYKKYNKKVVILVDEYDKPILDNITNKDVSNEIRDGLRNLYSVIKGSDEFVQFAFLTGVSKFSKVSLFSGLNNLQDITISKKYSDICGYTQKDIETTFLPYLENVNLEKLKEWYNGYNWDGESVYNPFDILLFVDNPNKDFKNYWFETATPTFLVELMRDKNYFLPKLANLEVSEALISSFDVNNIQVETLLFQAGYLTIKEKYTKRDRIHFKLEYPNKEVELSLADNFIDTLTLQTTEKFHYQDKIYDALESVNLENLETTLVSLFASIPYNNFINNDMYKYEGYYASVIYSYLASLGLSIIAEDITNIGRMDLSICFPNNEKIYILEFKIGTKENALKQIKEKNYHEKYLSKSKDIYLIGINFDIDKRNIDTFLWEKV